MKVSAFNLSHDQRRALYEAVGRLEDSAPAPGLPATPTLQSAPSPTVLCLTVGLWETFSHRQLLQLSRQQCATRNAGGNRAWFVGRRSTPAIYLSLRIREWLRRALRWFAVQAARIHQQTAPMFVLCHAPETSAAKPQGCAPILATSCAEGNPARGARNGQSPMADGNGGGR